jgi:peptidoglycan hydrolase-like protein with peptidoglycan-binding domain
MSTPPPDTVSAPSWDGPGPDGPGRDGPRQDGSGRDGSGRGKRGRAPVVVVAGLALAAAAGFTVRGLWPGAARPATAAAVPVPTAAIVRADVSARQVVGGTLGYQGAFSVVNELGDGILTWLPAPGSIVRRGQALFQLSGTPVTLLYGPVPAWRDFGPGMTPGPDVRELQRNLAALGFGSGPADGEFGWSTEAAIGRWQQARGLTVTGTIPLGEVTFLPGSLRVTAGAAQLGTPAAPGEAVLSGTTDTPGISVSLPVGGPAVRPGDPVLVTMPDGTTTVTGTVASVGTVATGGADAASAGAASNAAASSSASGASGALGASGASGASGQGSGPSPAAIPVTISIGATRIPAGLDQAPVQVSITEQRDRNVLAVPVTALLALPGGGYAVRLSDPARRLIPVTTGLFDDATGVIEVTGRGLAAGQAVEVAQG